MTSMKTNMEGYLDEQPPAKKPRIRGSKGQEQQGSDEHEPNGAGMNCDEQIEDLGTLTTTAIDFPRPHRKLPAEMNQQIYLCFNPATQRKFICGLGWDFYAMFRFRYRLLTKTVRVRNPSGNHWSSTNMRATVAADGLQLHVSDEVGIGTVNVFAEQAFPISGPQCRMDGFPGTICYYYEVKGRLWSTCSLGFSDGFIRVPDNSWLRRYPESYAIQPGGYFYECGHARHSQQWKFIKSAILPLRRIDGIDVYGCGLILDTENKLFIFFTMNGKLLTGKIAIGSTVDRLFPTLKMLWNSSIPCFDANFGNDPEKSFEYDIKNCPGLHLRRNEMQTDGSESGT